MDRRKPSPSMMLRDYQANTYSQCGEDGVLEEIIQRLGLGDLWCCEFGAWDGRLASNTFNLVQKRAARVIMIEGDADKYQDLLVTATQWPSITPINAYVDADPESTYHLDSILASTPIPRYFDILSIDIDGDDLDVWESIVDYEARIVIIEINPRIEPGIMQRHRDVDYDPTHNTDLNSFSSTVAVGQAKGYVLACHTSCNLIFVKQEFMQAIGLEQRYIDDPILLFDWKWVEKARKALRKRNRVSKKHKPNPWLETDPAKWCGKPLTYYTAVGRYFKRFRRDIFVETGTLVGNGLWCALQAGSDRCHSIEIHEHQYLQAVERFQTEIAQGRVQLHLGDSADILPAIIRDIDRSTLFWLDAHMSQNYGPRLAKACPALEELAAIDRSAIRNHVILIDDVACFDNPAHDNIPLQAIKDRILAINSTYQFELLDAVLPGNVLAAWVD